MKPQKCPGTRPAVLFLACLGCAGPFAHADQFDTFQPFVALDYDYDDNLFRISPLLDPAQFGVTKGRSDRSLTSSIGVKVDKQWSLQHVVLDGNLTDVRYDKYSFLNYRLTDFDASWLWQFTPRVSGTLAANQTVTLANYADFRHFGSREVITSDKRTFAVDWNIDAGWHAVAGLLQTEVKNSTPYTQETSSELNSVQAGGKYVTPSGNWLQVLVRDGHGTYPDQPLDATAFLDNEFDQRQVEITGAWQVTGKSGVTATIAQLNHQARHFAARNFEGLVGQLAANWQASGKLIFSASLKRQLTAYLDTFVEPGQPVPLYTSSYATTDLAQLAATWSVLPEAQLDLLYLSGRRTLHGEVLPVITRRVDTPETTTLIATWLPARQFTVTGLLAHDRRGSTIPGYDYTENSASVKVKWTF